MLTETSIRQAKPKDRDYKLADSEGLYLFVAKSDRRSWRLKYRFAGKEKRLILGTYPEISLKDVRTRKSAARKLIADGRDPGIEAQKLKTERSAAAANTFEVVARGWYAL